jgi:hypothetical protein
VTRLLDAYLAVDRSAELDDRGELAVLVTHPQTAASAVGGKDWILG